MGIGGGSNLKIIIGGTVDSEIHRGKDVGLGKLPAQFCGKAQARAAVREEVQLIGIAHSGFVDGFAADVPDVGDLGIVVVDIPELAADGAGGDRVVAVFNFVALGIGHRQPIVRRDVVVQSSKIPLPRPRIWIL